MDDLQAIRRDAVAFSQELDKFKQYLNNENEPPNTDGTEIKKFRSVVQDTLSRMLSEHSSIKRQVDEATEASEKLQKLLLSMQSLADKRETQLVKYGFSPVVRPLKKPYPDFQTFNKQVVKEDTKTNTESLTAKTPSLPSKAKSCTVVGDALIAKYTPAKNKTMTEVRVDHGDKTYTISPTSEAEQNDKDVNAMTGLKAKYALRNNKELQSNLGPDLAKRMERYSILPKETPMGGDPTLSESRVPAKIKPPSRYIGDLLSKYKSAQDDATKLDIAKSSTTPILVSPPTHNSETLVAVSQSDPTQRGKFSGRLNPQIPRPSLALQDEELEHTMCIPPRSTQPPAIKNDSLTPDHKEDGFELKTPMMGRNFSDSPAIGSFSTDLFKKSESKIAELNRESAVEQKSEEVNNENKDINQGAPVMPMSLSSLLSKYSQKHK